MSRKLNHIALCSVLFVGAAIVNAQQIHVWDLALTDQAGQMTVYNPDRDDAQFGTPVRSGNLDGDAFDDLVISAMAADGPPGGERRENAGEVAVYFSPGHIGGQVDLREKNPGVITIYGEQPRSIFGIKSEVADVDGNGQADLIIAVPGEDDLTGEEGAVYIGYSGFQW